MLVCPLTYPPRSNGFLWLVGENAAYTTVSMA